MFTNKWTYNVYLSYTIHVLENLVNQSDFGTSLVAQLVKNPLAMRETWVQSLGWEDPLEISLQYIPWNTHPLQYSGLENSKDCIVMGLQRAGRYWATFTFTFKVRILVMKSHLWWLKSGLNWGGSHGLGRSPEKGIATHSSILALRIPRTEELGGLQSIGSQRVRYDWVTNIFTFQLLGKS